jgi:FAD/FMN-containing dehydrogenase
MGKALQFGLTALLSIHSAVAAPTQSAFQACTEIKNALPNKVLINGIVSVKYDYETSQYWSTTLRQVKPACIVQPSSAEDVAATVLVLNKYSSVPFAIRSGGHDPNVGHATVQDGVLITMTNLQGAEYDAEKNVAYVKPGGEWNDVIGELEPHGVAIAGGRMGLVGVGGLLLQGGLSFLSAQEGLASDNIIGWETVMANGSIINVDANTHPDLAQAMRGSGSQFGIVTKFTVKVHPIGDVWGGSCVYDDSKKAALYSALHNFTANGAEDPKAAIIFSDVMLGAIKSTFMYYFYDGPERPATGPFADFMKISISCRPSRKKYSKLLRSNGELPGLLNSRISFRTFTVPYIASRPQMYSEISKKFESITASFRISHPTSQFSVDFQPLPSIIGKHSEAKGGNAMGLTASDPDRLILEIQGAWALAIDDARAYDLSKQLTDWLGQQVPAWLAEANMPAGYMPLYMNDAAGDQDVTGSYREVSKLRALQRSVDPNGLFRTRAGGYKY